MLGGFGEIHYQPGTKRLENVLDTPDVGSVFGVEHSLKRGKRQSQSFGERETANTGLFPGKIKGGFRRHESTRGNHVEGFSGRLGYRFSEPDSNGKSLVKTINSLDQRLFDAFSIGGSSTDINKLCHEKSGFIFCNRYGEKKPIHKSHTLSFHYVVFRNPEITKHGTKKPFADFLRPVFQRGSSGTKKNSSVTSLTVGLVKEKRKPIALGKSLDSSNQFVSVHDNKLTQICVNVKQFASGAK